MNFVVKKYKHKGYTIKIVVSKHMNEISGYVDHYQVVSFKTINKEWYTDSSSCLPNDVDKALSYIECMNKVKRIFENVKSKNNAHLTFEQLFELVKES